jgi:flagellar basal body P-ring formation protein FlgA
MTMFSSIQREHRRAVAKLTARYGFLLVTFMLPAHPAQAVEQALPLNAERVEATVRQHVIKSGPWPAENLDVRVLPFPNVALPAGPTVFRILKPAKGVTPGIVNFLLAADVFGRERARLWVKAEVRVFDNVLVSSAPLARHEWIDGQDVRLVRRDISSLTSRPFKSIDQVTGQQAAHAIEVNEILTQKSLERPTLMRRGSPVTLIYETRMLRVESPGLAVEGGKIGDMIQVKNPNSGKLLRGVVIDERTVRVN